MIASSVVLLLSSTAADVSRSTVVLFDTFEACHESYHAVLVFLMMSEIKMGNIYRGLIPSKELAALHFEREMVYYWLR